MKKLLLMIAILSSSLYGSAQDKLTKKNGEEIQVKVLEITPEMVKYKKFDNLEGPTISIYKREVFMINYAGGTKEIITPMPVQPQTQPQTQPQPIFNTYQPTPVAPNPLPEEPAPYMMKLNGPRFGVTYISRGELTRKLEERYDITSPVITQFGWQFETQIFNIE